MLNIAGLKLPMIGDHIITGNVYFVDSGATGASDSNDGLRPDRGHALATLDGAINKCTADNGDFIILMPGHAESATAIAADTAGVTIIGVGYGEAMPTITGTTAAADLIDVTADSVVIKNVKLVGGASGTTALIDVTADGDFFRLEDCYLAGATAPIDFITLATGADDVTILNNSFVGTGAGTDNFILCEGYVARLLVRGNFFDSTGSDGLDEAAIQFAISGSGPVWIDDNCFISNTNGDAMVLAVSENDPAMLISRNYGTVTDFTDIWSTITTQGAGFCDNRFAQPGTRCPTGSALLPATSAVA